MSQAALYKRVHLDLIEDNAIEVLIKREGRVEQGGGFKKVEEFVGLVRGRLFQQTGGGVSGADLVLTIPGVQVRSDRWGFVAPTVMRQVDPDTGELVLDVDDEPTWIPIDLEHGPHVTDQFDAENSHFEISKVWPRKERAELWGYVCELEEIKTKAEEE